MIELAKSFETVIIEPAKLIEAAMTELAESIEPLMIELLITGEQSYWQAPLRAQHERLERLFSEPHWNCDPAKRCVQQLMSLKTQQRFSWEIRFSLAQERVCEV